MSIRETTKVANNYFDEALEMSDTDEAGSQTYRQQERGAGGQLHARGDSPPSAKLSVSEDDYEEGDDDEDDDGEYDDDHRAEDEAFEEAMKKGRDGPAGAAAASKGGPLAAQGLQGSGKFGVMPVKTELREEEEDHDDEDDDPTHIGQFADPGLKEEIKQLLDYIARYSPQEQDLEPELKPFIPDLIPAIGDIDAFIKIPRVDQKPDMLGLALLDEPAGAQSDPSVLDLHLRAVSKAGQAVPQVVRSLDSENLRKDPKPIEAWIKNIKELHGKKPPPSVHYSRRMPDIEELMQVWPPELEEAFASTPLPNADIDLPLQKYSALIALLLDIPTTSAAPGSSTDKAAAGSEGKKAQPPSSNAHHNAIVEALHVIFTLYSEFKNSVHFKAMERTRMNVAGQSS
ncbi:intraflagellar transport complex B protein 46 C terminal-domain-containing protein [Entophlyctis helioformis]|nr:intraflagellar transport complex B protein 46 C terminal-domain-containing protein [Entophlyctis helioformis]